MRKLNATLLLGIVVAVLGFGLVLTYGRTVERRIADGRETVKVLVASENLSAGTPAGSLVDGSAYRLTSVPQAYVPAGALTDLDDVQGMALLGPVPKGTQLSRAMFGTATTAAAVAPSANGLAMAVEVGLSPGVARYISVGSIVDVFVTYEPGSASDGNQISNGRTKLFLSGAKVLAVDVAQPQAVSGDDETQQASAAQTVTNNVIAVLDVTPQDAERLVNAVSLGKLYLGLSAKDARHTTPTGVTPTDVVGANR
ncbi:MAG: Flp pilus assembly protein CpaB [Actinomycetota bacterium]